MSEISQWMFVIVMPDDDWGCGYVTEGMQLTDDPGYMGDIVRVNIMPTAQWWASFWNAS